MEKTIQIGIIGAGRIVRHHLAAFSQISSVSLRAISNRTISKAQEIANEFSVPQVYSDFRKMLDTEKLDAVLVLTSVDTIHAIALECIRRSVHVLLEKPPGLSVGEAQQIEREAQEQNVLVMVALNRRFVSTIRRAKELIKDDELKTIVIEAPERFSKAEACGKYSKKTLNSWVFANGIHCIDLFTFFAGEAEKIISFSKPEQHSYQAIITFKNNVVGHYFSNWDSPGNWGVILVTNNHKVTLLPLEKGIVLDKDGKTQNFDLSEIDTEFKPGFYEQAIHFSQAVMSWNSSPNLLKPACSISEALNTMELIEKIRQS